MEHGVKTVAILAGGYSSEREISLASGRTALAAFQEAGYNCLFVELTKKGFLLDGNLVKLTDLPVDYVFNVIHGTPGEDGHMSGMLEVLGLPHSTCPTFQSALTFNKAKCNALLRLSGIAVPKGEVFTQFPGADYFNQWSFPLFIKPNRSGSSFGVSRATNAAEIEDAFKGAFKEDYEVVVEEAVIGTEVGCGVVKTAYDLSTGMTFAEAKIQSIAITEIVPTDAAFFDYDAKYEGKSQEITPARLSDSISQNVSAISERVYALLDLRGIVRIDYIVNSDGLPVLIEVNSIPGLSPASIVPQQIGYRGQKLSSVFGAMAEEHMAEHDRK